LIGPSPTPFPIPSSAAKTAARTAANAGAHATARRLRGWAALAVLALNVGGVAGCATDTPDFEDVGPADELYAEGLETLEGWRLFWLIPIVNYSKAIETFQSILDNYPYSDYAVKAELQIADAYFADARFDEALSYYRDFGDLHPQHPRVPYTILQSARCHYEQIRSIDRDQTSTREALHFLELLIRNHPYAAETTEGESMLHTLRTRLSRNVLRIGDFYLTRREYQSAAERFRTVLNSYPGLGHDAEALFKLGVCYENLKREDEALRLFHVLVENFGGSRQARAAAAHIAAAN
jgi:outer membrane protein assembly factor BamD